MKRLFILPIILIAGIGALHSESVGTRHVVECGKWMELTATPMADYHFVRWSDNNTDSVRQIQVNGDAHYIAFFAANCEEYANWPVVTLYDWLIVLNVRAINAMGYYVSPNQVKWYRIVGEPDDMHNAFPQDDQLVATGYYLNYDRNLWGTGDYYCVADVSDNTGLLCDGLMRSEIVHYASSAKHQIALLPTVALPGQQLRLTGLDPHVQSHIVVYSSVGQLIGDLTTMGETEVLLTAAPTAGCYLVKVHSEQGEDVVRYIVNK